MATIKDVSKETGLSIGTVSRVFNNRGYISQETRDKVEAAVKKLNYQPNALARSLSKSSSKIIGIIMFHEILDMMSVIFSMPLLYFLVISYQYFQPWFLDIMEKKAEFPAF